MKLTFLGTRGYIDSYNSRHRRHTSTMVAYRDKKVMIDCGEDWLKKLGKISPNAVVITHPHPDHAFGLKAGSPCPVYAIQQAWDKIKSFPIESRNRRILAIRGAEKIAGITFEAFSVVHSIRAPAVGYRIQAGGAAIFYVPDVVRIRGRSEAFRGIDVYIGDGATISRPILRRDKRSNQLIGHTTIREQLIWCRKEGVSRMVITHCGSAIVKGNEDRINEGLRQWAEEHGVTAEIAYDGMELTLE
ncbi:MAG: MBL fold metallo-hydrolase [Deltaproteobacteria bacterium]|nr:MBL fold metallo-hydrolase [Deltaproteobacteria bacterium]